MEEQKDLQRLQCKLMGHTEVQLVDVENGLYMFLPDCQLTEADQGMRPQSETPLELGNSEATISGEHP